MNKTYLIIGIAVILVLVVGGIVFMGTKQDYSDNKNGLTTSKSNTYSEESNEGLQEQTSTVSLSELAMHNNAQDCWLVYNGKVYDLSSWIDQHPGGVDKISPHCGKETFQEAFTKKHGTSKAQLFMSVAKYMGDIDQVGEIAS